MDRWVTFTRDYLWFPQAYGRAVHIAFKAGMTIFATQEAAVETTLKGAVRQSTDEEIARARAKRQTRRADVRRRA
jgi:hypothetical protein